MHHRRPIALLFAVPLVLASAPGWAAGNVQFNQRSATLGLTSFVGIGIADANLPCTGLPTPDPVELCSVSGSLGSPGSVVVDTVPGRLEIGGSATADGAEGQWSAVLSLSWTTWQDSALANDGSDAVLSAAGGHQSSMASEVFGPGVAPGTTGTRDVRVWNLQSLTFTLDQSTSYTLAGSSFGEYMPLNLARDDGTGAFVGVTLPGVTAVSPFSFSGVLSAGRYRIRNFDAVQTDGQGEYAYGWSYSMRFHDTVAAVPEPAPLATLALGLGVIGVWRRRAVAHG